MLRCELTVSTASERDTSFLDWWVSSYGAAAWFWWSAKGSGGYAPMPEMRRPNVHFFN